MFIAALALAIVASHVTAEIPSYIHVCGRLDPNIDQCIINSVNSLKEELCNGIPELKVPPIEPLIIDKIAMTETNNNKIYLKDLVVNGLCDFDITSFHLDLEKNSFDIDISFKHIHINATYDFDVRILVPIVQQGKIAITTDNVKALTHMDMKVINKNGKSYAYMSQMKINLDIKGYNAQYDLNQRNLGELGRAIGSFVGTNQQAIIAAVKGPLEQMISKRILMLSNEIVKNFTFDELFPERA